MVFNYQMGAYKTVQRHAMGHVLSAGIKSPVKPRFHTLVVGPTGGGKSHVAKDALTKLGFDVKVLTTSAWIVLGAKSRPTLFSIIDFFEDTGDKPRAILLDEIDKVGGHDSWTTNLRSEIYDLLDGRISIGGDDEAHYDSDAIGRARGTIKNVHVVGCGAFDGLINTRTAGFVSSGGEINLKQLKAAIPQELLNRFSTQLAIIPPLGVEDYKEMRDDVLNNMGEGEIKEKAKEFADIIFDEAVICQSGARYCEDFVGAAISTVAEQLGKGGLIEPIRVYNSKGIECDTYEPEGDLL